MAYNALSGTVLAAQEYSPGDLIVGNDEQGNGGKTFNKATYACRPPGVYHGPFKSENGCTLFELHYYKNDEEF